MCAADPSLRVILVVDDEPGVRRLVCYMLERGGFSTREAETGREALAALISQPGGIALVLSDIRMPEMNGLELEQAIRDEWPALPVILMSGEVTREWVVRLVRDVPLRVMRKPFDQQELLHLVHELLGEGDRPGEEPRIG
jgi:DNA-binding NtrC family response regulator